MQKTTPEKIWRLNCGDRFDHNYQCAINTHEHKMYYRTYTHEASTPGTPTKMMYETSQKSRNFRKKLFI
jgi:hypothetical protein